MNTPQTGTLTFMSAEEVPDYSMQEVALFVCEHGRSVRYGSPTIFRWFDSIGEHETLGEDLFAAVRFALKEWKDGA